MNTSLLLMNAILTGNKILDSELGQGAQSLLNDLISAAQIIGGLIVFLVFIKVSAQKANEEEQERKRYNKWQIALVCILILIVLAKDIINLVLGYFGGGI